ncbi:putative oxidoreductase [Nonomuraea solani]|uniref:Putative oxidoreductase n=1 Tax=Nonomuraea solani TaxID=1144553 RepID=A0A1H6D4Z6_9ACTN|nr:DoxX family protein [Nonomuraea solani]SEG80321.1 putative oxidoreductase [Nonomuraea solani]
MNRVAFDVAALIARIVTGVIFVAHGWQKWQAGLGATTLGFREMGIPLPELAAGFATVVETVGGIFLILGLLVRPVGLLLLVNMLGAIAFVHGGNGILSANGGWEFPGALAVLSLLFLALGGGRIGLDGIFGAMYRRRSERHAAEDEAVVRSHRRTNPQAGGPTTPTQTTAERPDVPRQPTSGRVNDEDMRDIDALVSDEPPQHRKPPNR